MRKIVFVTGLIVLFSCKKNNLTITDIVFSGEFPVMLSTEIYFNESVRNLEPSYNYNWADPVKSDLLDANSYAPGPCNNYIRDGFGPRTLGGYDLHLGIDIADCISHNGEDYNDTNPPTIYSMCSGIVDNIDEANKCSVYIICDDGFANTNMGENVEFVYRHLQEFDADFVEGGRIEKGAPIGIMGMCEANKRHLHLSCVGSNPHKNVNGARMFDMDRNDYFNRLDQGNTDDVSIQIVSSNDENTIVRFALLGNKVSTVQLGVETAKYGDVYYNFEEVNSLANGSEERDNPCFVDKICVYAYDYNGEKPACEMYESQKDELPIDFPGSAVRGEGYYYPIECNGLNAKVAIVYDFVLKGFSMADLEQEFGKTFRPYVLGVFGDGVQVK